MLVKVKKLHDEAVIPKYATTGSSGFDFYSVESYTIYPGQTVLVKTGLAFSIPEDTEIQVRPRSGLSLKTGMRVANAPGTVDEDFRGEVCVIMENTGTQTYNIKKHERVAQGVLCPVFKADFEVVEDLSDTERGAGGFGSSGS